MKPKAVVYKEHTLGILYPGNWLDTLHRNVFKSTKAYQNDGPIIVDDADIRPATQQDFDDYRVCWHPDYT